MDLIEKAKELGQLLAQSEEFLRFKKAEAQQKTDVQSQAMLAKYNTKRMELMQRAQKEDITAEEMQAIRDEMEKEYDVLATNPNIVEYIEATGEFTQLTQQINAAISFYITPEKEEGSCSGDCSGCAGCH